MPSTYTTNLGIELPADGELEMDKFAVLGTGDSDKLAVQHGRLFGSRCGGNEWL